MGRRIKPFSAEMEIIDGAVDGKGIAKHEGRVVFVEGAVPGDKGLVHVYGKRKKNLLGRVERMDQPSSDRTEPRCQHFQVCGGCKWQHMTYEAQLRQKERQVINTLERVGKVKIGEKLPILGVEGEPFFYRNKLEFSFSSKVWMTREEIASGMPRPEIALGYHAPGSFDKVFNVEECLLQLPIVNEIRNAVRDFTQEKGYPYYDNKANEGLLRELAFRTSVASGEVLVNLIMAEDRPEVVDAIFSHLTDLFPQITQYLWVVNQKVNSVYTDLPFRVWKGTPYLTERLGDYQFRIRPLSFFQTNPKQAEVLYGVVQDFLKETLADDQAKHEVVYDLYSGTGSIGIFVSAWAENIVGIEYVESAVVDARENVRLNDLAEDRFSFYAGDMKQLLTPELVAKEGIPNVLIADPPRQGMDKKVVRQILEVSPAYIIYVSCKPATQARDLELLKEKYEVLKTQPVDMFPHTAHVENVVLMKKR
ncbi:MAG: 23S rRNA (uracil(1939)-C(5))-methyltransferase RlmD [Bacteroidota bacterium]